MQKKVKKLKPGERCTECQNYNHVDCKKGKGTGDCNCDVCQIPGTKYEIIWIASRNG